MQTNENHTTKPKNAYEHSIDSFLYYDEQQYRIPNVEQKMEEKKLTQ